MDLPEDLDWIRPEVIDSWSHLGGTDSTAQVHPFKFTTFILKRCSSLATRPWCWVPSSESTPG